MALSKGVIEKIKVSKTKGSWLDKVNRDLVNNAISELRKVYQEKKLSLDIYPITHISLALRDMLKLSTDNPYNQLKALRERLEELGFTLIKHGKSFAVQLEPKPKPKKPKKNQK